MTKVETNEKGLEKSKPLSGERGIRTLGTV